MPCGRQHGDRDNEALVLWNIDGTHVRSGKSAVEVFNQALRHIYRLEGEIVRIWTAGKTDRQIARVTIIGDTPRDVACARAGGARVIAVATGVRHTFEELARHEPDALFESLRDTQAVLDVLERLIIDDRDGKRS